MEREGERSESAALKHDTENTVCCYMCGCLRSHVEFCWHEIASIPSGSAAANQVGLGIKHRNTRNTNERRDTA